MIFKLTESAVDSLDLAVDFYEKYMRDKQNKHLKLTIICLHNSIELFSKQILYEENEMYIFKDSFKEFFNYLNMKEKKSFKEYLDIKSIFTNLNVKTINYSECSKRLKIVFKNEFKKEYELIFKDIGRLRNNIIHFVTNNTDDIYRVLAIINKGFDLISEFFYPVLKGNIEDKSIENRLTKVIENRLIKVIQKAQELSMDMANAWYSRLYDKLHGLFEQVLKERYVVDLIRKNNISYELNRLTEDIDYVELTLNKTILYTCINPYLEAIAIIDIGDKQEAIYAVIDFAQQTKIYVFNNPEYQYKNFFNLSTRFWRRNNKTDKNELSIKSVKKLIEQIIKAN